MKFLNELLRNGIVKRVAAKELLVVEAMSNCGERRAEELQRMAVEQCSKEAMGYGVASS